MKIAQCVAVWALVVAVSCTSETLELPPGSAADAGLAMNDAAKSDANNPDAAQPDGAQSDAGMTMDAALPPTGDYWTLEPKAAQVRILGDYYEGGAAYVRVEMYPDHMCEHGGPVEIELSSDGTFVVHAFAWLHHIAAPGESPCDFITDQVLRDVALPTVASGNFAVVDSMSGSREEVVVDPPGSDCSGIGVDCQGHCDCSDVSECVPCVGSPSCVGRCATPCNPVRTGCCGSIHPDANLECPPEEACRSASNGNFASAFCEFHGADPCSTDNECPPGMFCPVTGVPRGCMWEVQLNASVRHPCQTSNECESGLVCVLHGDGVARCDIPCFTNRSRCPPMHVCRGDDWVCEWVGE